MENAATIMILVLCLSSAGCWAWLAMRGRSGAVPRDERPRERPPIELLAVALAVLWIAQSLYQRYSEAEPQPNRVTQEDAAVIEDEAAPATKDSFDPQQVLKRLREQCLLQMLLFGVMLLALSRAGLRPLSEFGFRWSVFGRQFASGVFATTLSWLPVLGVVLLTRELRTVERQHSVLRMLDEAPGLETWFWAIFAAVVLAPAVEELLYRVVLQSWLFSWLGAPVAISITALAFSAVHAFPDSLALIPLALILGCTWHWRFSYVTIVTAHACFNGMMLVVEALQSGV
jgi:CAAX protease family protein